MKTFLERFKDRVDLTDGTVVLREPEYRQIQLDTLHSAERAVHDISRGTKSEDRAIALDDAEVAIISLSSTL